MPRSTDGVRRWRALCLLCSVATPVAAETLPADIVVTARPDTIERAPNSAAAIDAAAIATTVNATNVEDTLKYLPSLVVRKRHIGDQQAPLATRTSGLGASARSLIYADGALLSALIGNNNTIASPRWSLVSPQEIARIDILYGPFSAAYPGNSIGAVVNITTRLPDKLEATATAATSLQRFRDYATRATLPAYQTGATIGDRFGPLALFASVDRVESRGQPLAYATALRPTSPSASGTPASGGYDDLNRTGAAIRVLGAAGFEHQRQVNAKLKVALDVTPQVRLAYVAGLFLDKTDAGAETYLTAAGQAAYAGTLNLAGYAYTIPASAFSANVYHHDGRQWSHSLSATGTSATIDWQLIGTLFDFAHDVQRLPTGALPAAAGGGAGAIVDLGGTGWRTLDTKAAWRAGGGHVVSAGAHYDGFRLESDRYATTDWIAGRRGSLTVASRGRTRTAALWAQDAWTILPPLTLTIGGRQEWWRAYDGRNISAAPPLDVIQPTLAAARFSPKASARWQVAPGWAATASFGEAYRFPTVSELYQAVTTGATLSVPDPSLRPERALSGELALERTARWGTARVSLFEEQIRDALLAQSTPVNGGAQIASFVQNVDRVHTRGIELALGTHDLLPGIDLSASLTLIDPRIRADAAFPAAIDKRPPQLPLRKASLVATWHPLPALSLTGGARYASRSFGTIDNSDFNSRTYQGFGGYVVADARAVVEAGRHLRLGLGVDNIGARRYFLFHPFPQRTFRLDVNWVL